MGYTSSGIVSSIGNLIRGRLLMIAGLAFLCWLVPAAVIDYRSEQRQDVETGHAPDNPVPTFEEGYTCLEMIDGIAEVQRNRLGRELSGYEYRKVEESVRVARHNAGLSPC